jgi:hypothetical protein
MRMTTIVASEVQAWVNDATASGLSARSVVKYHAFLHGIFERALVDQVLIVNPCHRTALPKSLRLRRCGESEQFEALLTQIPDDTRS